MKTEEKKIVMAMFLVVWVITVAGQTVFLEAANASYASNPSPADGAVIPGEILLDNIWTKLIFVPGATAVEHTGYFSDNYDDVAGRIEDANLGSPPYAAVPGWEYTFFAGNPQVPPADETLVRGVTYYWCVDETDSLGFTYPGDIWEFTVQGYKACCPNPPDGAVVSGPDVLLSWISGFGVEEHDVYFGTDFNDVNDTVSGPHDSEPPPEYLGTVEELNMLVTGLSENTKYYWRVDEVSGRLPPPLPGGTIYKGDVWCFKTAGLIAHLKFDEGSGSVAYDSAGNNDGTIYGAAWASGVIDGALDFDGVDDYVEVADDYSLDLGTHDLSFTFWFKTSESSIGEMLTKRSTTNGPSNRVWDGYSAVMFEDGTVNVHFRHSASSDSGVVITSTASYNDGNWHHLAGVYTRSANLELYVDGLSEGIPGDISYAEKEDINLTQPLAIGCRVVYGRSNDLYFNGAIDEVGIYDRALSAVEIEELYNSVPVPPVGKTYHVDGVNGDNTNDGLTRETAFKTIQRGINVAEDFDTVLVWPGVYNEEISFWGDAITVKSAADAAVVETDYGYAFSFFSAEGADTVLSNFVIRNSQYGIYLINGASPTLRNLTIVNNDFGISAFNGADPDISSCIFWNNYYGDLFRDPIPLEAKYSWLEGEVNEPIAHWKLDEGSGSVAYDSAGTNNGTLYGSPNWVSGISGSALDFDGVGERDYVLIAGQSGLLGGDQFDDLMVEAWIKTSTINNTGPYAAIVADETTDGEFALAVNEFGNAYGVIYMEGSTGAQLLYGPNVTDGVWHHLHLRKDSSEVALFVDGNKNDTVASTGPLRVNQQTHVTLGCKYTTYLSVQFIGIIDEVAIYNGASGLADPGFVDAAGGDYHLLSERGRYWPAHDVWVLDDVTSPCIDGGDPSVDPANERMPNGGRINMGAYGNSAYASMSEWPLKHDSNFDGVVDMRDLAELALEWLETIPVIPEPNVPDVTPPDTLAPLPDPMQWDPADDPNGYDGRPLEVFLAPFGPTDYGATMRAIDADDQAPAGVAPAEVEYYFQCQDDGAFDSGWRTVAAYPNELERRIYTVRIGGSGLAYRFRVKARDVSDNLNETDWSDWYPAIYRDPP